MTENTVLNNIAVVSLDVAIWSGRKKLRPEDFKNVSDEQIPPERLANLGSKRIFNPEALAVFNTLKKRATRILETVGTRFLGGFAVPEHQVTEVVQSLETLREAFLAAKSEFLDQYDAELLHWIDQNPDWRHLIEREILIPAEVAKKFGFAVQVYRVNPPAPSASADEPVNRGLQEAIEELGHGLFAEVAHEARVLWRASFEGKPQVTQKALRPIRLIREKLSGLSFVDPLVYPAVAQIDATLAAIGPTTPIEGPLLTALTGLLHILSDAPRLAAHCQGLLDTAKAAGTSVRAPLLSGGLSTPEPDSASLDAESGEDKAATAEAGVASPKPVTVPVAGTGWFF